MKYVVTIVSLIMLISGCANMARTDHAGDQQYIDMKLAVQGSKPIGTLERGKSPKVKISLDSPHIKADNAKGRFEILSISGKKDDQFKIAAISPCDCLGFQKWVVRPHIYLLNSEGILVGTSTTENPSSIAGTFPNDDTYYLFIVADETNSGKTVGSISVGVAIPGQPYVPDAFALPMKIHPTGNVIVTWTENTKNDSTAEKNN